MSSISGWFQVIVDSNAQKLRRKLRILFKKFLSSFLVSNFRGYQLTPDCVYIRAYTTNEKKVRIFFLKELSCEGFWEGDVCRWSWTVFILHFSSFDTSSWNSVTTLFPGLQRGCSCLYHDGCGCTTTSWKERWPHKKNWRPANRSDLKILKASGAVAGTLRGEAPEFVPSTNPLMTPIPQTPGRDFGGKTLDFGFLCHYVLFLYVLMVFVYFLIFLS